MNGIDTRKFYSRDAIAKQEIKNESTSRVPSWVKQSRRMPSHILGPRNFWMEFSEQAKALATAVEETDQLEMLCTFVYQNDNGYRKFVVAHPEVYWWHYEHREPERRCSYEVIPENSPSRLYLDLEFSLELNPESDGPAMTSTVIDIFLAYLLAYWGLPCNRYNVLNLDSSTSQKFSRHIVFNFEDVAFKDNYHVGRLVKSICRDILNCIASDTQQPSCVLSCIAREKLRALLVETNGNRRLFVDTAVYTKNRHFRIYKSTKWGKGSNLTIAEDCKYIPSSTSKNKELNIFMDSLISYFVSRKGLILLEYSEAGAIDAKQFRGKVKHNYPEDGRCHSEYPMLDKYIRKLIHPGKIRLCKYFDSAKLLLYETTGYRYCENIGRCHKSNNVFWIVDVAAKAIYQKCHDQDCFGFKSEPKGLPEEISFEISEEDDMLLSCAVLAEDLT